MKIKTLKEIMLENHPKGKHDEGYFEARVNGYASTFNHALMSIEGNILELIELIKSNKKRKKEKLEIEIKNLMLACKAIDKARRKLANHDRKEWRGRRKGGKNGS